MDAKEEKKVQPAFDVIEKAISEKAFPRATLAVGYRGKVSVHAFGKLSYDREGGAANPNTMYDIASLTKVVRRPRRREISGRRFAVPLDLDAKIERYLPEWRGAERGSGGSSTVRHLLTHTSGCRRSRNIGARQIQGDAKRSNSKQGHAARIFRGAAGNTNRGRGKFTPTSESFDGGDRRSG